MRDKGQPSSNSAREAEVMIAELLLGDANTLHAQDTLGDERSVGFRRAQPLYRRKARQKAEQGRRGGWWRIWKVLRFWW